MQHRVNTSGRRIAASLVLAVLLGPLATSGCVPDGPSEPRDLTGDEGNPPGPATPLTGSILASLETSGVEAPDSLQVALDDAEPRPVPASGMFTWSDVTPGVHLVTLGGLPENCALAGGNPKQVTVQAGLQVTAAFGIQCVATVGELRVTVSTSGDTGADRDGYRVEVDALGVDERIGIEATLLFVDLEPGEYTVRLRDVNRDCDVADGDRAEAQVTAGQRTEVAFAVHCED